MSPSSLRKVATELENLLDQSDDEAPLQRYLSENAWILHALGGFKYAFDKVRLGSRHITDFATVAWGNYETWTLIELEPPSARLFTKAGLYSRHLNTSIRQIHDWTIWLRDHNELDGEEISPLHGEDVRAIIVIGRRRDLMRIGRRRLMQINGTGPNELLKIVTYDVLVDFVRDQTEATFDRLRERLIEARRYRTVREFRDRLFAPAP